jgi:hypothetical protein
MHVEQCDILHPQIHKKNWLLTALNGLYLPTMCTGTLLEIEFNVK